MTRAETGMTVVPFMLAGRIKTGSVRGNLFVAAARMFWPMKSGNDVQAEKDNLDPGNRRCMRAHPPKVVKVEDGLGMVPTNRSLKSAIFEMWARGPLIPGTSHFNSREMPA